RVDREVLAQEEHVSLPPLAVARHLPQVREGAAEVPRLGEDADGRGTARHVLARGGDRVERGDGALGGARALDLGDDVERVAGCAAERGSERLPAARGTPVAGRRPDGGLIVLDRPV